MEAHNEPLLNVNMTCRICGNNNGNQSYSIKEMMFGCGDEFEYLQCSRCKCLQISEFPDNMSRYYPSGYYSFSPGLKIKYGSAIKRAFRRMRGHYSVLGHGFGGKLMRNLFPNDKFNAISRINLTRKSRILDVGCGSGGLLYALKEAGFVNLLGIDPYLKGDIHYDNGLNVLRKAIHDLQDEYDLIMYHHSFEHVSDPYLELESVSRRLSPGGICMMRIPTASSFAWEHYQEHWYQIDAPRHYFLHSVGSMEMLAGRTGFHLQKIVYDSTVDQFRCSELYKRGIPFVSGGEAKHLFTKSQIRAWKKDARRLNKAMQGDQAVFYLVKK